MLTTISNPELWIEGLTTMVVGMGIVFLFLIILVFAIFIMARIVAYINKVCPIVDTTVKQVKKTNADDSEIAIAVALCAAQNK